MGKAGKWWSTHILLFVYLVGHMTLPAMGDLKADGAALMAFLGGLAGAPRVKNWSNATSPCTWVGVGCTAAKDGVVSLKLPGVGLYGSIQPGTLGKLTNLQILSLRSNSLSGSIPPDLTNCTQIKKLFLQHNLLTGTLLPFSRAYTPALATIDLSFNGLTGGIPPSLTSLSLRILRLQNNSLSGSIPQNFTFTGKVGDFSLANNNLSGSIPSGLRTLPSSSFSGNVQLCGLPLAACPSPSPSPSPPPSPPSSSPPTTPKSTPKSKKLNTFELVLLIVAALVLSLLLVACCLICYLGFHIKRLARSASSSSAMAVGGSETKKKDKELVRNNDDSKEEYSSAQEPAHNKLVFFQGGPLNFDLEDLLRASAEVLGKGSFGTAYKAVLEDGAMVVVKRLKEVVVSRKEFEQHMDSIGRLRHPNLVPLRAYYFSKEEKLLVLDYFCIGSLSALLHGPKKTVLDWETRLRIAIGAANGLAHMHGISSKMVHGDIKSSNVLVKNDYEACVSDYGLVGLFGPNVMSGRAGPAIAGYRAPELGTKKPTKMSDVYSFGVVLLELLTGRAPWQPSAEEGMELVKWVQSVVQEEWTSEVFDKELKRYEHIEEEMVELLQLGLACVVPSPDERPSMVQVLSSLRNVHPTLALPEGMSSSPAPQHEATPLTSSDYSSHDDVSAPTDSVTESYSFPPPIHESSASTQPSTHTQEST